MSAEALFYLKSENKKTQCTLCPHNCIISEGKTGICKVRKNEKGKLVSLNYGRLSAVNLDPVEKKPLYHFYPGKNILSLGSIGCNLKCFFCQNNHISQAEQGKFYETLSHTPDSVVKRALRERNNIGIAYTYNEPTVWYEFMLDTAIEIHKNGLKNVMVTNGYINPEPLKKLLPYIDAFNVDLKAFSDKFYTENTKSSLKPVLETIKLINEHKKHTEITFLLIPSLNDNLSEFEKMLEFLNKVSGNNTILHISRYFPSYKSKIPATEISKVIEFYSKAEEYFNYACFRQKNHRKYLSYLFSKLYIFF